MQGKPFFQNFLVPDFFSIVDLAKIKSLKIKMASLASSNTPSSIANFDDWCTRWDIPTSVIQLCNDLGAIVPSDLAELDAEEIEEFILENQLKKIEAKRFRRGYQAVVQVMVGVSSSCVCLFLCLLSLHSL